MLKIRCRGCGALSKISTPVGDKKSIRCPKCEETVPLPKRSASSEASVESEPATLRIARSDQPRRPKRNSSRSANPALSLLAGAIAFVVCGGLAYTFVSGLTRPSDQAEFSVSRATSPAEPSPQASSPAQAAPAPTTITVSLDPTAAPAVSTAEDTEDAPPPGKITARSFIPAGREWLLAVVAHVPLITDVPKPLQPLVERMEAKEIVPGTNCENFYLLMEDRALLIIVSARNSIPDEKISARFKGLENQEYRGTTIYLESTGPFQFYALVVDKKIVVYSSDLTMLKQSIDQSMKGIRGSSGLPEKCVFAFRVSDMTRLDRAYRFFLYGHVEKQKETQVAIPLTAGLPSWARDLKTVAMTLSVDNGLRLVGTLEAKDRISAETLAAYLRTNRELLRAVVSQARTNKAVEATKEQNEVIDRLLAADVTVSSSRISLNMHIDQHSRDQLGQFLLDSFVSGKFAALIAPSKPAVASDKEPAKVPRATFMPVTEAAKPPKIPPLVAVRPTFNLAGKELAAGTAFAIRWPGEKRPILLTALHLFGPSGGLDVTLKSEELPNRVNGVMLSDLRTDKEIGKGGKALSLVGGYGLTEDGDGSGDVAAFYLPTNTKLDARELAKEIPKFGDVIWLVGQSGDQPNTPQRLYASWVSKSTDTLLEYTFEPPIEIRATSGAPLVNSAGEIVGIHLGGGNYENGCFGIANPTPSIRKRLEAAMKNK